MKECKCPECNEKIRPQFSSEDVPVNGKIYKYVLAQCPKCGHIFYISQLNDMSHYNIVQEINRLLRPLDLISQHFQDTTGED